MPTNPLKDLSPGDGFRVRSRSGNVYECTLVAIGPESAGLYVRLLGDTRKIARLDPSRLDLNTFEVVLSGPVLVPGDTIVFSANGTENRGKIVEQTDERLVITRSDGSFFSTPTDRVEGDSLRLIFRANGLCGGDEFLIRSQGGRQYRGKVVAVRSTQVVANLHPSGERVTMSIDRLAMDTLEVLVPVKLLEIGTGAPS